MRFCMYFGNLNIACSFDLCDFDCRFCHCLRRWRGGFGGSIGIYDYNAGSRHFASK